MRVKFTFTIIVVVVLMIRRLNARTHKKSSLDASSYWKPSHYYNCLSVRERELHQQIQYDEPDRLLMNNEETERIVSNDERTLLTREFFVPIQNPCTPINLLCA